jgi:anti-sigma B factor antagonist
MSSPVRAVTYGTRVVVHLAGEVDIFTTAKLREQLGELIAQSHTDIVVDLTGVTFIDSTGLGVLVGALRSVRARGGRVQLVTNSQPILKALRITALSRLFTVHADLLTALSHPVDDVVEWFAGPVTGQSPDWDLPGAPG